MIESNESRQHYLFAILLFIAGLLIILIFLTVRSQADDTTASASVSNATPTIDSVTIAESTGGADSDAITPVAGSTKTVYVHGAFHDDNGCAEVTAAAQGVKVLLYSPNTTSSCDTDNADCYENDGGVACSYTNCAVGTDTVANYECQFALQYYADPGDWTAYVTANDGTATSTADSSNTTTLAEITGISLSGSINYGGVSLGGTSTIGTGSTISMSNKGNVTEDYRFSGSNMTCDVGTVDVGQQHYASGLGGINSSTAYASLYALGSSASTVQHDMAKATASAQSTTSSYWQITLPSNGVSGTCTGTITVTGIKSV